MLTQCETWASLVKHNADIVAAIEEKQTKVFFLLIAVMLQKPGTQRKVVKNGSRA